MRTYVGNLLVVLSVTSLCRADITFLNTWGSLGSEEGQFNEPSGIAASPTGQVYVVDEANGRIQRFSNAGRYINSFGVIRPRDVAVSPTGDVYVVSRAAPIKFSSEGTWLKNLPNFFAIMNSTFTVATSPQAVYVALRRSGESNIIVWTYADTVSTGFSPTPSVPSGIAASPTGDLYIQYADEILRLSSEGAQINAWKWPSPFGLSPITVSPSGKVYVGNSSDDVVEWFQKRP